MLPQEETVSYQPPQNSDQSSPWSGGEAARDGGPQGPSHDASQDAPRYGVRSSDGAAQGSEAQQGGIPQYGRRDDARVGAESGAGRDSYGRPVGFGSQQAQSGYQQAQSGGGYQPSPYGGAGMQNQDPYTQGGYQPRGSVKDGRGMGIAGLVLGIISLLLCWLLGLFIITAIIGLILSIIALVRASRARAGKGFGIAGVILNGIALLLNALMLVFTLILGAGMAQIFSDPDLRACFDTLSNSEMTTQDQADFEQCIDDGMDQQLEQTTS
ncbi:DUF4190 domain-containing protein [Kocuria palustris]|uniref:DUF4190 domain-containing protein n=1 Tax=Kocuria palustris TaxID=71999 RepID=UPI001642A8D3|nr:DUF4190 domain-containing protein [Kocuria palustris]